MSIDIDVLIIFFEIKNPLIIPDKTATIMVDADIYDAAEYLTVEFCFSLR
jgi:hypothetical protein